MADTYEVLIDNISTSGNSVTVESPTLVKGLVKNPDATLALLSAKVAPISLADIDIDQQGRVVVNNQAFGIALSALGGGSSMGNNCAC